MKSKLLLGLALVLSSVLSGCSTATRYCCDGQSPKVAAVAKVKLKFVQADSEETNGEDGYGENAVDGNPNTYWHTQWHGKSPGLPHAIIIELLPPSVIKGFTYLPRQDESDHGTIKVYEFYVSDDGRNFGQPVKKGAFEPGKGEKIETFEPIKCRFIKLKAISEIHGLPWTSAAEIRVIQSGEDGTHRVQAPAIRNPARQIQKLIAQLDDKEYARREAAVTALARVPDLSLPALKKALAQRGAGDRWWLEAALREAEEAAQKSGPGAE
jgi:hypothetical protein